MNIKPTKSNVLIDEIKEENKSDSGLILTGTDLQDTPTALVIAVGPDVTEVKFGDKIIPDWSKGTVVEVFDRQGVMIKEEDIIGVINE